MRPDLQAELDSLIEQAINFELVPTRERSHYYAASVAKRCKKRIEELERQLAQARHRYESDEAILNTITKAICLPGESSITTEEVAKRFVDLKEQLAQAQKAARELLAVIHRDGGHHTETFGFESSCQRAIDIVLEDRVKLDAATRDHPRKEGQ